MGFLKTTAIWGGVALAGTAGAMVVTNPDQAAYEVFATQQLKTYLVNNVCGDMPSGLGNLLRMRCEELVNDNEGQLSQIISSNTTVRNYGLFSLYKTTLAAPEALPELSLLPTYEVEAVGVFRRFVIYRAEKL